MYQLNANQIYHPLIQQIDIQQAAVKLFTRHLWTGLFLRQLKTLLRRPDRLEKLEMVSQYNQVERGIQTISLDDVVGSESRTAEFSCNFLPCSSRLRDRWISVMAARMCGTVLPPVFLIEYAGKYYVRDGHHRISVAKALGEAFIEAHIIQRSI